jgi:hypothetical protein
MRDIFDLGFTEAFGMKIYEQPVKIVPILKVSDSVEMTDCAREEMNAWLLEMFGTREVSAIPKGMALVFGDKLVMRPETCAIIRNLGA